MKDELLSFSLSVRNELAGDYTWRLKDSEIRYRGTQRYAELVGQRIPASVEQISNFGDALNLLDVWTWRDDYDIQDTGWMAMDGSHWSFEVAKGDRTYKCGGFNGYPSFADASQTTTEEGRFALLVAAMYSCFKLEYYVQGRGEEGGSDEV